MLMLQTHSHNNMNITFTIEVYAFLYYQVNLWYFQIGMDLLMDNQDLQKSMDILWTCNSLNCGHFVDLQSLCGHYMDL
jgi:hypothetical protein